jgi:hypothetical protein
MNTVSLSVFQPRLLATCPFTPTPCPHAHPTVYSSALEWLPQGSEMPDETGCRFTASQAGRFPADALPAPVHPDILLARLRPGQVRMCVCVGGGGHEEVSCPVHVEEQWAGCTVGHSNRGGAFAA